PDFFVNAFYAGGGVMVYGVGLPPGFTLGGQAWNFTSGSLDIVAHELTHGVTEFTSNLIYQNESGALNEAFSDIIGTSAEFFFQPAGSGSLRADYLLGEDVVTPGGIRSMENPNVFGDPDHYSRRFLGTAGNGDQIEKVFYRAFTQLMPANSTFAVARAATIQAARDLYGAGSNPERAV